MISQCGLLRSVRCNNSVLKFALFLEARLSTWQKNPPATQVVWLPLWCCCIHNRRCCTQPQKSINTLQSRTWLPPHRGEYSGQSVVFWCFFLSNLIIISHRSFNLIAVIAAATESISERSFCQVFLPGDRVAKKKNEIIVASPSWSEN